MSQSNGGVATTSRLTLYPAQVVNTQGINFYAFDPAVGFNCEADAFYSFKVEEVLPGRAPTLGQVIITYTDIGQVTLSLGLSGSNDQQQVIAVVIFPVVLGNVAPTGRTLTKIIGVGNLFGACQNPQLSIFRAGGAGPLAISQVVIAGRVEPNQVYA